MSFRLAVLALSVTLTCVVAGCGKPEAQVAPPPDSTAALEQLGRFYKYLAYERQRPPAKPADLTAYPPESIPDAWPLIQSGDIVIVWGSGYSATSNQILAYEKAVETNGGKVLMQNGTVKEMTAETFKAARGGR
jgi:hypothetical protein